MYEFQEDTKSLLNPATGMSLMTLARAVSARGQGWKSDYHDRGYGEGEEAESVHFSNSPWSWL